MIKIVYPSKFDCVKNARLAQKSMSHRNAAASKRSAEEAFGESSTMTSPFQPMFEQFRAELDEHHDRRERIVKASRDITAASKKM